MNHLPTTLTIILPEWIHSAINSEQLYSGDHDKMALAIGLARLNVEQGSGGPFGAAIFDGHGRLVSVGVNQVVAANNSVLHAEVMAIMLAEKQAGSFSLADGYELFTSCEPCAMCLGATLWSGIKRIVCAASGEDARAIGFDEGPVFAQSWQYLESRGITVEHGFMHDDARAILVQYQQDGKIIYNPRP